MHAVDRLRLLDHEHESGAVIRAYTRTLLCLRHCRTLYAPTSRIPSRQHTKNLSLSLSNTYCTDNCGRSALLLPQLGPPPHHSPFQRPNVTRRKIRYSRAGAAYQNVRSPRIGAPSLSIYIYMLCLPLRRLRARPPTVFGPSEHAIVTCVKWPHRCCRCELQRCSVRPILCRGHLNTAAGPSRPPRTQAQL